MAKLPERPPVPHYPNDGITLSAGLVLRLAIAQRAQLVRAGAIPSGNPLLEAKFHELVPALEQSGWLAVEELRWSATRPAHSDELKKTLDMLQKTDKLATVTKFLEYKYAIAQNTVHVKEYDRNTIFQLVALGRDLFHAAWHDKNTRDALIGKLRPFDLAQALVSARTP